MIDTHRADKPRDSDWYTYDTARGKRSYIEPVSGKALRVNWQLAQGNSNTRRIILALSDIPRAYRPGFKPCLQMGSDVYQAPCPVASEQFEDTDPVPCSTDAMKSEIWVHSQKGLYIANQRTVRRTSSRHLKRIGTGRLPGT